MHRGVSVTSDVVLDFLKSNPIPRRLTPPPSFSPNFPSSAAACSDDRATTMSSQSMIDTHREGAEVYHGAEICKNQSMSLLEELHLPRGLLPLACMEEVGYHRAAGFVWLRQSKATTHVFKAIGRTVSYAAEVTAFVEDRRMKRMTGVKSRELLIWVSLSDMYIDNPESKRITFRTSAGLGRSFPVSAFELAEEVAAEKVAEAKKGDDESK